ncbi:DNA-binding transcriptional activator GcvA [compost metagenome]
MVARKLTPAHRVLVAAPGYLDQRPPIDGPQALQRHDGILIRSPQTGRVRSWPLTSRWQEQQPLLLRQAMTMSDSDAACAVAQQGLGIALVSLPFAVPYLQAGRLQRVLPDWYVDDGHISLYYAQHKLLPGKTRAFIDFVVEQFAQQGLAGQFDALQRL